MEDRRGHKIVRAMATGGIFYGWSHFKVVGRSDHLVLVGSTMLDGVRHCGGAAMHDLTSLSCMVWGP